MRRVRLNKLPIASKTNHSKDLSPKYYVDVNAISPSKTREIGAYFKRTCIMLVDGSIMANPPRFKEVGSWYNPCFIMSREGTRGLNLDHVFDIYAFGS